MSPSNEQILALVDQIYSTVAAPDRWSAVVANISRLGGTPKGLLFTPHHGMEAGGLWFGHNFGDGELESYIDYYHQTDVWTQRALARRLPAGKPFQCDALVPPGELDGSEFYNDYLKHVDIREACCVMFDGEAASYPRVHLSLYRPVASERFEPGTAELLKILAPHLHRALDLGFRFAALGNRVRDELEALNRLQSPVAALDQEGAIMFMNRQAKRILASNDGLAIRRQCIVASNNHDNEGLWKLIRNVIGAQNKGNKSPGGVVAVSRPSGVRSYAVTVAPGAGIRGIGEVPVARALVFIADPAQHAELPVDRVARLYGLTAAEAQLAVGLADGQTLGEYAETWALSMHTVRSTLKQVFAKTDTRRQAELVRLLLTVSATDPEPLEPERSAPLPGP